MKCTQSSCGKNFAKPLELYNGALVCPHCKKELSVVTEFKLTERNQELYNISELYLFRYLSPDSQDETKGSSLKLKPEEMINLAIENCRQSAKEGNPYAAYRMGYYNEFFLETVRSEKDKMRIAFDYYSSLCYCDLVQPKVEQGATPITTEEFGFLKRQAGVALLNLCINNSKALKGASRYDFERNKKRLTEIYGPLPVEKSVTDSRAGTRIQSIFKILLSCIKKERTPLWGLFMLNGAELKELFSLKSNEKDNKPELFKLISKGVEFRYLPCDSQGNITKNVDDRQFIRLIGESKIKERIASIKDNENIYLYLFNSKGSHDLPNSQIKRIGEKLSSKNFYDVCTLIDYSAQEYLFFDDDILYFKKKGSKIEKCVELLIKHIAGGKE